MALVTLTTEQQAAAASALARSTRLHLADQVDEFAARVQRDLIACASHVQAMLNAEEHPAAAAKYARDAAANIQQQIARYIPPERLVEVTTAMGVYGFTAAEIEVIYLVMVAAAARLADTAKDGSAVATDAADVLAAMHSPNLLW
jgi:hypothetical protein